MPCFLSCFIMGAKNTVEKRAQKLRKMGRMDGVDQCVGAPVRVMQPCMQQGAAGTAPLAYGAVNCVPTAPTQQAMDTNL